jgi:hypothetical protein
MKKLFFFLPALAFSVFFAFCSKMDVQEDITPTNTNTAVAERTDCCFNVYSDNIHDITFCGTNLNSAPCLDCNNNLAKGVTVMVGNGSPICLPYNTKFYVRTASPGGSWINLASTTPGNNPGWVYIPANDCQGYYVDGNCGLITF